MAIYRGPGGPGDATTDATNEATVATTKASEAAASASSAASSASTASTKASESATSATQSATSATNAANSAASASSSATSASNSSSAAELSKTEAETAKANAEIAQAAAEAAQAAAETAETNAETAETNAAASASAASTSESNAATSETNAASSASAAAASEAAAASYVDAFDDKYLGSKASAPTVDNDGDPLTDGALYFNTTTNIMYVYDLGTTSWLQLTLTTANQTAVNTVATNIADVNTVATNILDVVNFGTTYLGAYASAPTTSQVGAIYWNTGVNSLYIWDGSTWNAAAFTATGAVTSFNTRTGAVTLSSGDVTTALGYTPSTVANLNDISDVTITSPSTNQVLKYNGTVWVNDSDTDTGIVYTDLSVSTATAGSPALSYNNTNGVFTYTPPDLSSFITASSTDTLTNKSGNISQWTNDSGYLTSYTETDPVVGAITGIVKADGAGNISASVAGTDYLAPAAIGVTVQAYDADTAKYDDATANFTGTLQNGGHTVLTNASDYLDSADIGVNVQAYDSTIVVDADIGVSVQAYDADTAKTDTAQTYTASQRGTVTTDNDLSFDQSVTNNFSCTPSSGGTLTFTNHTAGQSGYVLLDNSSGYAITAAATTKITATDLTTISTAGVYLISYFDNGTNAYLTVSASYS